MTGTPLLDTHAWIWWIDRDRRLGQSTIDALDRLPEDARPYLSDISLWEVATLVERGRLSFSIPFDDWLEAAAHPRTVRTSPSRRPSPVPSPRSRRRSIATPPTA